MAVLTLIIMLLLSITLRMAWKHWELLKGVRKEHAEARDVFGNEIAVDGDELLSTASGNRPMVISI